MKSRLLGTCCASVLTFLVTSANAATIQFNPDALTVVAGDPFSLTLEGIDFTGGTVAGTTGGTVFVNWDPNVVSLLSASLDPSFSSGGNIGAIDNVTGSVQVNAASLSPIGADGSAFNIAGLNFSALAPGVSTNTISLFLPVSPWFDGNFVALDPQPTTLDGTVTVNAVPVPAAVWLFGSGFLGLIGIARKKAAA